MRLHRLSRRKKKLLMISSYLLYKNQEKITKRWILPHITLKREQGLFQNLLNELRETEGNLSNRSSMSFTNFLRVSPDIFDMLLAKVTPIIERKDTNFRLSISPGERLAVTLRYLATGESFRSLGYQFRIGETTIGTIIPEACVALYETLHETYFQCPNTAEKWSEVAKGFLEKWNMPNTLGALDGKHVTIQPPVNSGSSFYNYKHRFSIVLMALVDSNYKFLYCDVGCNGRVSDGGVFKGCTLNEAMKNRTVNFPSPKSLPGIQGQEMNHFVVADEAFPLQVDLMKPYGQKNLTAEKRVFNYRLSRARRVVENAFGILSNRFRVFLTTISLPPEKVEKLVLAACCLHNLLLQHGVTQCNQNETAETSTGLCQQASLPSGTNVSLKAKEQRDFLCTYFNTIGAVPFQWERC